MRFLRLATFVNAFYPKYFYAPQQFRSFFQFFCSFALFILFVCLLFAHFIALLVEGTYTDSFDSLSIFTLAFVFNAFRFLPLLVEGTLFHWLSVAALPLLPLPLPLLLLLPYHSSPPTWFTHKVGF